MKFLTAIISVVAVFIHMTLDTLPQDVKFSQEKTITLKKENTRTLNLYKQHGFDLASGRIKNDENYIIKLKKYSKDYLAANKAMLIQRDIHRKLLDSKKILGFDNLKFFLGEFWSLTMLIYALTNCFIHYEKNKLKYKWELLRHSIYVYIGGFFTTYIFLISFPAEKADFSTIFYYYSMAFCILFIIPCAYFINKYLKNTSEITLIKYILYLINQPLLENTSIAVENTTGETKEALLNGIEKIEKEAYAIIKEVKLKRGK